MEKETVSNLPITLTELASILVFVAISITAFFVPFSLGHPQWLVGTIVNACLFLAAIFLPKKYFIPLTVLPSLGVLVRGIILGPLTLFLVYFLPFIWLGNLILILFFKFLFSKAKFVLSVIASSAVKCIFLLLAVNIYFELSVVPAVFLRAMSLNQLATALAGGLIAFLIFQFYGKSEPRN